ncbi:hypothetical protein HJC23_010805 [Cyclotella cryptica]|uniref:L domain-like protein n=1 Tax=Cyclotella cryptica TaxID=29204 RepID=A0ABD3QPV3_9STRA
MIPADPFRKALTQVKTSNFDYIRIRNDQHEARTWRSIEIGAINAIIDNDPLLGSSSQLAMEDMTFMYSSFASVSAEYSIKSSSAIPIYNPPSDTTTYFTPTPSSMPSMPDEPTNFIHAQLTAAPFRTSGAPSINPSAATESITSQINLIPNDTSVPTWSPSAQYEATNGNCNQDEILHRLVMYDSNGVGWDSTAFVIKETDSLNATFQKGPVDETGVNSHNNSTSNAVNGTEYLCLKRSACYSAEFSNETMIYGILWEIYQVDLAAGIDTTLLVSGTGYGCQFGLEGSACVKSCTGMRIQRRSPETNLTSVPTTNYPVISPTKPPTPPPSLTRTRRPTTPAPSVYLPQDMEVSFGSSRYKRLANVILDASPNSQEALSNEQSPQYTAFVWTYNTENKLSDKRIVLRWVLASFYFGLNGDNWLYNKGWLSGNNNECEWYGITCLDGEVTQIALEENRMTGGDCSRAWNDYDTPEEERNRVVMPVPSFLGDMTYLTYLNLEGLGLTSSIPDNLFSSWNRLVSLYMNDNDITGTLPKSLANLKSIQVLWLGGNSLGGSIIPEIGQLTTLVDLSLESNFREDKAGKRGFVTALPPEIGRLTNLETLDISDNALSGTVPIQLGDLISLRRLDLSNNFFENQLPTALGRLQMLEELDISFNWLSSTIPREYGDMISLTSLSLESNYKDESGYFTWGIHSTLPTELGKLKNLKHLLLNDNYLSGTLITEIGQLYFLETLHLQNNFLLGPIPLEYSNCVLLEEILLEGNNIDGSLYSMPEDICRLPELELARVDCKISCSCCYGC